MKLNGFNESYRWPGGEDPDLGLRVTNQGYLLGFNENACVYHHYSTKLSKHIISSFNYGRGKYRLGRQHFPEMVWRIEPTLLYPVRLVEQLRILKAYFHNRENAS